MVNPIPEAPATQPLPTPLPVQPPMYSQSQQLPTPQPVQQEPPTPSEEDLAKVYKDDGTYRLAHLRLLNDHVFVVSQQNQLLAEQNNLLRGTQVPQ